MQETITSSIFASFLDNKWPLCPFDAEIKRITLDENNTEIEEKPYLGIKGKELLDKQFIYLILLIDFNPHQKTLFSRLNRRSKVICESYFSYKTVENSIIICHEDTLKILLENQCEYFERSDQIEEKAKQLKLPFKHTHPIKIKFICKDDSLVYLKNYEKLDIWSTDTYYNATYEVHGYQDPFQSSESQSSSDIEKSNFSLESLQSRELQSEGEMIDSYGKLIYTPKKPRSKSMSEKLYIPQFHSPKKSSKKYDKKHGCCFTNPCWPCWDEMNVCTWETISTTSEFVGNWLQFVEQVKQIYQKSSEQTQNIIRKRFTSWYIKTIPQRYSFVSPDKRDHLVDQYLKQIIFDSQDQVTIYDCQNCKDSFALLEEAQIHISSKICFV